MIHLYAGPHSLATTSDSVKIGWVQHYASQLAPSWDQAHAVAVDRAGNIYVTGISTKLPYGAQQWIARYNAPGNLPDRPIALEIDRTGNVYVTGSAYHTPDGINSDYTTIKYNSGGVEQWVARYNGPANSVDEATGLAVDGAGNVYVTGASVGSGPASPGPGTPSLDYVTIKYNSAGVQQWVARYNSPANSTDRAEAIAVDKFGNVYVTGESWNPVTFYDFATIKYNAYGIEQWVARYNGPSNYSDFTSGLATDALGNAYVIGSSNTIIKYDTKGIQAWIVRHDQPENGYARSIAFDASGNIYVTRSRDAYSENDHTIAKYNSNGVEQWNVRYQGASAKALEVDFAGNVYVAGSASGALWSIFTTVKYMQSSSGLQTPSGYWLAQNFPNPFSYATSIRYAIPKAGHVTLKVYDLLGQEMETIISVEHLAGVHEIFWGSGTLPSGVYVYRLQARGFTETKKLILLK